MNLGRFINIQFDTLALNFERSLDNETIAGSKHDEIINTLPNIRTFKDKSIRSYKVKGESLKIQNLDLKTIKVIGHRGNGENTKTNQEPLENTIESYELAIQKGADMIELDVHLTVDKKLVIFHDNEIKGKMISQMTFEEFEKAYESIHSANKSRAITLETVFEKLPLEFPIYVEVKFEEMEPNIKNYRDEYVSDLVEEAIQLILKHPKRKIIFASFSPTVCALLKARLENSHVLLLINSTIQKVFKNNEFCPAIIKLVETFNLDGLVFDTECKADFEPALDHIKKKGLTLMCYGDGANNEVEIKRLSEYGVTGFCTDDIILCKNAMKRS